MQHDTTDAQWAHEQELESRRLQEERPLDPREIDERIRQAASILKPVQDHMLRALKMQTCSMRRSLNFGFMPC